MNKGKYNNNKKTKSVNNGNRKKQSRKRKRINVRFVIFTAVLFFIIGFVFSYLYFTRDIYDDDRYAENGTDMNNTGTNNNGNQGTTSQEDGKTADNSGENGKNTDEKEPDTKTDPSNNVGENAGDKTQDKGTGNDSEVKVPSNPAKPNVEKLNVEALEKLSNTKLSWWIRLNNENKPTTIPDDIRALLEKYDGIFQGDTTKKVVYLTFDEGYENGYTAKILDILKENNVKTIFFVTGSYIDKNPDLIQRMIDEGHQIGNHTVNHPSLPDVGYEKLEDELLGIDRKLYEKFGVSTKYMRPPSGEYSERVLAAAHQLGYKTVFWSYAFDDWYADKIRGADYAYNKVMGNLHNGAVILLHAVSKDNADALDRIIKDIKAQGYEINPFDL